MLTKGICQRYRLIGKQISKGVIRLKFVHLETGICHVFHICRVFSAHVKGIYIVREKQIRIYNVKHIGG